MTAMPERPGDAAPDAAGIPVVLDTNALLLPFTEGTDLEHQLDEMLGANHWLIPQSVLFELDQISRQGNGKVPRAARMARKLAARGKAVPTRQTGDDGFLEVARGHRAVVVTNDRILQSEAEKSGLRVIVAREHGRLAWRKSGSS